MNENCDMEIEGLKEIKFMNLEFLRSGEGSEATREFLTNIYDDDAFILRFLRGRKHRPKHAWESIKRYAEVRFDIYPDMFASLSENPAKTLLRDFIIIVLKARDSKGRRIVCFNASYWDPETYNMDVVTIASVQIVERLILDEDCINNGVVAIQECSLMGVKHAKQYSLRNMLRMVNIFWYAFPLKVKGVYYMNVPYFLSFLYGIIRPFLPKKLKERVSTISVKNECLFVLTAAGKGFDKLHERIPAEVLPKCLGGTLENIEACDLKLLNI